MPVTAIPFKSPPPFDLPPYLTESLRDMSLPAAVEQVEQILMDSGCADAILSALIDANGHVRPGPYRVHDARQTEAMKAVYDEMAGRNLALDSEEGRADFLGQAVHGGQPLLMMGELEPNGPDPFPAGLRTALLQGQPKANLGFMYVFPIKDENGRVHGAMALHRALGSGPLNHDQPAITHALILELARRAGHLADQV